MAPTVVRDGQFRLFFFSREEPRIHVHVAHPDGEAKFWLTPAVSLANHTGLSVKQLAADLGYASFPAFSHAFRQVTGKTPTEFAEEK